MNELYTNCLLFTFLLAECNNWQNQQIVVQGSKEVDADTRLSP